MAQEATVLVLLQRWLPRYRVPFFERLRLRLAEDGVRLQVVHSQPQLGDRARNDEGYLAWANVVENRRLGLGTRSLLWQPSWGRARAADVVIVEQANSLLLNHALLAMQLARPIRLCFWGHGRDMQASSPNSISERYKRRSARVAHWWFAYTSVTAGILRGAGVSPERITVVQNAVDVTPVKQAAGDDGGRIEERRAAVGLQGGPTAVFLGALHRHKRLDYLLSAAQRIRARLPDFQLMVIGGGPDAPRVKDFSRTHPWSHYFGPRFDDEKGRLLALADVMLLPAAVNLAILDAFAAGLPVFASASARHMPEIAYLQPNVNGVLVDDLGDPGRYAAAVVSALGNPPDLRRLSEGGKQSSKVLTIEAMVDRFAQGVIQALEAQVPRRKPTSSSSAGT